jgi:glyoxylase-like metal-dependent hydrolase (beta-lactamase superfamily II)
MDQHPLPEKSPATPPSSLHLIPGPTGRWLLEGDLYLQDRPGALAELSSTIAHHSANIERFSYNRSQNANLVQVAASVAAAHLAGRLADELRAAGCFNAPDEQQNKPEITDLAGLLRIKASLDDRPGALADLAVLFKEHRANVIYMAYDGQKAPGLAEIAMATPRADEVHALLQDLNQRGYHYFVEWQGDGASPIDEVIGLNVVERFLLSLKAALPPEKLDELGELIRSSAELNQTLLNFKREAGGSNESMAASEVFTSILQLATSSLSKTGSAFSLRLTGPVQLTPRVSLLMLSCPTGANGYLLRCSEGSLLIDSSYGLYYRDAMSALAGCGIDPSKIRCALFTHADADHAGWAAPLERDYGTEIYMHPDSPAIFEHENRAYGSGTRLMALNGYYTKLINRFTDLRPPRAIHPFPAASGKVGAFEVTGRFELADLQLLVLQSHGGHVPAQVFFYAPSQGALFCGDYLIDFASLSDRTKSALSIPRYLMTSTNSDGRMFAKEMKCLSELILAADADQRRSGRCATVFPGHGEFYRVRDAAGMLHELLQRD